MIRNLKDQELLENCKTSIWQGGLFLSILFYSNLLLRVGNPIRRSLRP
jgi:hypothetical protein